MPKRAVCPTDDNHEHFVTVAYVSEDWVVDADGNFIDIYQHTGQILHKPHHENIWRCLTCNAEAVTICI